MEGHYKLGTSIWIKNRLPRCLSSRYLQLNTDAIFCRLQLSTVSSSRMQMTSAWHATSQRRFGSIHQFYWISFFRKICSGQLKISPLIKKGIQFCDNPNLKCFCKSSMKLPTRLEPTQNVQLPYYQKSWDTVLRIAFTKLHEKHREGYISLFEHSK